MANQPPNIVDPDEVNGSLDPRYATPFNRIFDMNARLEAVKLHGTVAVLGPKPTFYNSDENVPPPDGPADGDDHEYEIDPWGRPRETLLREENPFANRNVTQGDHDDRRGTDVGEFPQFGNFGPYFRKVDTLGNVAPKNIAPKHTSGKYDINPFIDEELKKDPYALNPNLNEWRREVEFQFGERAPSPPPRLGPAPGPGDATYDFSSLSILFKNGIIRPILVPHPSIRSPLAPQRGTNEEMDADYQRINSLPLELCASWWVAKILWFIGENDASLIRTIGMVQEGSCPKEVFPYELHPGNFNKLDSYKFESVALYLYEPLHIRENRPDPIENSFWVPKLKGVNGSAMKSMRVPFLESCPLDTRYAPVPVLQSTVLPQRYDIRRPELKLWDGIPGHTFRLPPYFWPDELEDRHLDGHDQPFAVDIRRIPVNPPPGTVHPRSSETFRPTRRLNTVCRDRAKGPQNEKRIYLPSENTPTAKRPQGAGQNQLGGNSPDDDSLPPSFLQDEFEYDLVGDVWGPVGGFRGRDYDAERKKDHDMWYRYFLVNNDPLERTIVVNNVPVKPGAIAGPLPAFAMFELGDQAAFWFGVGGRNYDPNTPSVPSDMPLQTTIVRTKSPGQATGAPVGASWVVTGPLANLPSPATATAAIFSNLDLGQTQNQPAQQDPVWAPRPLRPDAPEFVPGSLGGLERLGLRGGAGTPADLNAAGSGGGAAPPAAKRGPSAAVAPNPYHFTAVALQPTTKETPQYISGETPPYMSTGVLESRLERLGVCVDPSWNRERLLEELLKVKIQYQSAHEEERANTQTGVAQGQIAEREARARAERMIAAVSENSELEQRHMCEGFGIIISPEWSPARIREEIVRLYETAYQELSSNNTAATEYEATMGLPVNSIEPDETSDVVKIMFWLACRYMYRQRSAAGLRALCGKYGIDIYDTLGTERVIVEIIRAVERQRQIGIARKAAHDASMRASIATIAAIEAEIVRVRAFMVEMAKAAKAKAGPTVIDLTTSPKTIGVGRGRTLIDLTYSP